PSGSVFPEGTTTVTYKVTDLAGLEAQCSFDIEVQNTLELDTLIVNFDDCLPTPPEAVVSGGTIPYVTTFDLDESDSVLVFTVNILDSNSCRFTAMIPIEINNEIKSAWWKLSLKLSQARWTAELLLR
ncbi:MAG TPA: HYR domain-containing protein, partial [Saprospiraceae bacterium]|nr:HYR domain-containing protein [Saprospiraceae bacterium]